MNLWGRGSPRFPFIQPMQGAMDFAAYEQFPFQNPAWDVPHPAFAPNLCAPVAASEIFYSERCNETLQQNWNRNNESSPKNSREEGNKATSQNFWQHKSNSEPDDENSDKNKKDFKDGKGSQYPDRRSEKRERSDKHRDRDDRDRDRDRSRHRSRDDRTSSKDRRDSDSRRESPERRDRREHSGDRDWRSSERDGCSREKDKRSRERERSRDRRDRDSAEKDQFGRDVSRSSRRSSRERKDRSPKRKRDDDDGYRRRDDRHRDRDRDRDDEGPSKRHRSGDQMDSKFSLEAANYKTQTPNETVMIRGLAQHITENDIRQDILQCGMMPKDIRLIRKKETGASRGFAFVEFNSTEEARYWMEMKQGVLMFQDQYRAIMQFSIISNDNLPSSVWMPPTDWDCPKCFAHNFKKRVSCFKCHAPRPEVNDGLDCSNEISPHPTTKLILRNLDVLTNEETLLKEISNVSNIPIQSCQIARDSLTDLSRGVCYLEMKNVLEAIKLYNALTATVLTIEGRKVNVSYCKLHLDKPQSQPSTLTQNQWAACGLSETDYKLEDVPRLAEYSAQMYATNPQEHAAYVQYYTQYYTSQISQNLKGGNPVQQGTGTNAAAAVAQSAIKQAQSKKAVISAAATPAPSTYLSSRQLIGNTSIGEPDVTSYTYDETSGYFFDQNTGLYYDAGSQYYYHSQDQIFLYWDSEKRAYMPAPTDDKSGNQSKGDDGNKDDKKKDKDKDKGQDKVKVAKRIAKDMERWAKTLNQKKEIAKMNAVAIQQAAAAAKSASTADIAFAVLERKEQSVTLPCPEPAPQIEHSQSNLVASYGGGSDSDEGADDNQSEDKFHTDWVKLACLLCKRQFPTKEALCRHQQLSDLHKQNLEAWYSSRGLENPSQRMYRDRAKERREKFGIPDEPRPNRLKEKYLKEKEAQEEPSRSSGGPGAAIPAENVGSKMLQKMGWTEGMGLGRSNQGRTEIIQPNQRVSTAGLGSAGSTLGTAGMGSSYKDNVKRSMMARYSELDS